MSWTVPRIKEGPAPVSRGGHAMAVLGDQVLLSGGANREPRVMGDTWLLRTDEEPYRWEQLAQTPISKKEPTSLVQRPSTTLDARTGAAVAVLEDRVLVFGGYDPTTGQGFNDVASFDLNSRKWSSVKTQGEPPPPTHSHTACYLPPQPDGGVVVLLGGATEEGCSNLLYAFDPVTSTWLRPKTTGPVPSPREMHSAALISAQKLLISGGRGSDGHVLSDGAVLDVATWQWSPCKLPENAFPRCAHTITRAQRGARELILYGGFTGEDVDGLLFSLDPETLEATVLCDAASAAASASAYGSALPPPRFAHAAVSISRSQLKAAHAKDTSDLLLVFGGVNPIEDLNDLAVWDQSKEGCKPTDDDSESRTPLFLEEVMA